jgi:hypothetical protein
MVRSTFVPALVTRSFVAAVVLLAAACPALGPATAAADPGAIGLSLFFTDGQMAPLTLVGDPARYLQEVDIVANTPVTTTDQGLAPLIESSDFSRLDWTGIHLVEEDWRPDVDGTWILQRFYRGARRSTRPATRSATR